MLALCIAVCSLRALAPDDETLEARVQEYVADFVAHDHLWGTLLVARDDVVLFEQSWGLANAEHVVPNQLGTPFCVASVTKPMTIVLVAQLTTEGKLGRYDKLQQWLPGFPRGNEITVDDLLTHRAGIPHRLTTAEQETRPRTAADMVERATLAPLDFEPGSRSSYSSGGYSVLARILELAGGASYGELLATRLFEPLGMESSTHWEGGTLLRGHATSYRQTGRGLRPTALMDTSFLVGAGSVWATPSDLFLLQRALLEDQLDPVAKSALLRPNGLAWNGITNGFRAFADYHADQNLHVIFAGNVMTGAIDRVRADLPRLAKGEVLEPGVVPAVEPVKVDAETLNTLEGAYQLGSGAPLEVRVVDGCLEVNDWVLVPSAGDRFFSIQDYGWVEFTREDDEGPLGMRWETPGRSDWIPRLGED